MTDPSTRLAALRELLPDPARDLKINLQNVLQESTLTPEQRWGVAVACGLATRNPRLAQALLEDARDQVAPAVVDDARAAATLMAMNNVFYRFKHLVGKDEYQSLPARLRMTRLARPATRKADFELMCLAVSAVNNCETCVRAHEKVVREAGLSAEQVHDAIRVAAVVAGVAVGLELGV